MHCACCLEVSEAAQAGGPFAEMKEQAVKEKNQTQIGPLMRMRYSALSAFLTLTSLSFGCGAQFQPLAGEETPHEFSSGGSVADTAPSINPGAGLEDQVAIRGPKSKFPKSPMSDWLFPILDGRYGSMWCVCRNIGTSPHIGVDLIDSAKLPDQVSIAMSNGKVESVEYDASCGWSVMFRDSSDSLWRYLHLNKPGVKKGQEVVRGTTLGINRDYPKAGCGAGTHLHLERRSAGRFGSKEEFRSCQYGRTSCYYNPVSPIEKTIRLADNSARQRVVNQTLAKINNKDTSVLALSNTQVPDSGLDFAQAKVEAKSTSSAALCNSVLKTTRVDGALSSLKEHAYSSKLRVDHFDAKEVDKSLLLMSFKMSLDSNVENTCKGKSSASPLDMDCIQSWKLFVKSSRGENYLAFEATGTGNAPVELRAEQLTCLELPQGAVANELKFVFEGKNAKGETFSFERPF